jgi:biotin carboxyl carrier protein
VGLTKQINAIKAPMPGLILEISVIVGQTERKRQFVNFRSYENGK